MEKIDFLNCDEFKLIKEIMKLSDNDKTGFTMDVRADDPNLEISSEGITYKGRRVILYIRDQVQYGDKTGEYKFHLIDCATLKSCGTRIATENMSFRLQQAENSR